MINLVNPNIKFKKQYIEMIEEWKAVGEELEPWVLKESYLDFNMMVQKFQQLSEGIGVMEGLVPNTTYWAYDSTSDKIIGVINIRHYLNDLFLKAWGNIGYGVRPSERKRGHATIILKLALKECKGLNMNKVLLGCYKENTASVKTILKNGGILENETIEDDTGKIIQRYWIDI